MHLFLGYGETSISAAGKLRSDRHWPWFTLSIIEKLVHIFLLVLPYVEGRQQQKWLFCPAKYCGIHNQKIKKSDQSNQVKTVTFLFVCFPSTHDIVYICSYSSANMAAHANKPTTDCDKCRIFCKTLIKCMMLSIPAPLAWMMVGLLRGEHATCGYWPTDIEDYPSCYVNTTVWPLPCQIPRTYDETDLIVEGCAGVRNGQCYLILTHLFSESCAKLASLESFDSLGRHCANVDSWFVNCIDKRLWFCFYLSSKNVYWKL